MPKFLYYIHFYIEFFVVYLKVVFLTKIYRIYYSIIIIIIVGKINVRLKKKEIMQKGNCKL